MNLSLLTNKQMEMRTDKFYDLRILSNNAGGNGCL